MGTDPPLRRKKAGTQVATTSTEEEGPAVQASGSSKRKAVTELKRKSKKGGKSGLTANKVPGVLPVDISIETGEDTEKESEFQSNAPDVEESARESPSAARAQTSKQGASVPAVPSPPRTSTEKAGTGGAGKNRRMLPKCGVPVTVVMSTDANEMEAAKQLGKEVEVEAGRAAAARIRQWPQHEKDRIYQLLVENDKNFAKVQSEMPDKSRGELMQYYYAALKRKFLPGGGGDPLMAAQYIHLKQKCRELRIARLQPDDTVGNADECCICGGGSVVVSLLCCETCPTSCHTTCAGLKDVPEGSWHCNECIAKGLSGMKRQPIARDTSMFSSDNGSYQPSPQNNSRYKREENTFQTFNEEDEYSSEGGTERKSKEARESDSDFEGRSQREIARSKKRSARAVLPSSPAHVGSPGHIHAPRIRQRVRDSRGGEGLMSVHEDHESAFNGPLGLKLVPAPYSYLSPRR